MKPGSENKRYIKKRTRKIIDRLTYSPKKHKNKERRQLLERMRDKNKQNIEVPVTKDTLKFGSFNVNGLDIEARWAVEQILDIRGFDVSDKMGISTEFVEFIDTYNILLHLSGPGLV